MTLYCPFWPACQLWPVNFDLANFVYWLSASIKLSNHANRHDTVKQLLRYVSGILKLIICWNQRHWNFVYSDIFPLFCDITYDNLGHIIIGNQAILTTLTCWRYFTMIIAENVTFANTYTLNVRLHLSYLILVDLSCEISPATLIKQAKTVISTLHML